MKTTYKYWVDAKEGGHLPGKYHEFRNYKIWKSYKEYGFEQVRKWDLEQSFTGQFIFKGFEQFLPKEKINPTCNWFGVSVYQPDLIMAKGNKKIVMSLQGIGMRLDSDILIKYKELLDACACRYILLKEGEETVYETWTGQLPEKELINKFLA